MGNLYGLLFYGIKSFFGSTYNDFMPPDKYELKGGKVAVKAVVLDVDSLVCSWQEYRLGMDWTMGFKSLRKFSGESWAFSKESDSCYKLYLNGKEYVFSLSWKMELCVNDVSLGFFVEMLRMDLVLVCDSGEGIFHISFCGAGNGSLHLWLDTVMNRVLCYAWDKKNTFLVSTLIDMEGLPKQAKERLERLRGRIVKSVMFGTIVGNRIY